MELKTKTLIAVVLISAIAVYLVYLFDEYANPVTDYKQSSCALKGIRELLLSLTDSEPLGLTAYNAEAHLNQETAFMIAFRNPDQFITTWSMKLTDANGNECGGDRGGLKDYNCYDTIDAFYSRNFMIDFGYGNFYEWYVVLKPSLSTPVDKKYVFNISVFTCPYTSTGSLVWDCTSSKKITYSKKFTMTVTK